MFESCKNTAMSAAFQTMSVTLWMCVESVAAMYVILWQAKLVLHLTGKGCSHTKKVMAVLQGTQAQSKKVFCCNTIRSLQMELCFSWLWVSFNI